MSWTEADQADLEKIKAEILREKEEKQQSLSAAIRAELKRIREESREKQAAAYEEIRKKYQDPETSAEPEAKADPYEAVKNKYKR